MQHGYSHAWRAYTTQTTAVRRRLNRYLDTAPRLRAGESHGDCGGDADGTTDAVALAAAAETAHDAAPATTRHAARSIKRIPGVHGADGGRVTAVSLVTTPRLWAEESHDDDGGDADVTTGSVAWAAAAESAADAPLAAVGNALAAAAEPAPRAPPPATTGHAAQTPVRSLGVHGADDGREAAVSTGAAPRLQPGESHDNGSGDADVTTGAVALAAAAGTAHDVPLAI
jgi:hypothetical protein